jgi:hypothetical protein
MITVVLTKVQTQHLLNISLERYCYTNYSLHRNTQQICPCSLHGRKYGPLTQWRIMLRHTLISLSTWKHSGFQNAQNVRCVC